MTVKELLKGADVLSYNGCENMEVSGVTGNSREIKKGDAFVCINGTKFDGHNFLPEVHKSGAALAICERVPEYSEIPYVLVNNTRFAASYIFANANGNPEKAMKLVGITGTNGKTSTAFMLRHIFENAGYKCGIIGTVINSWLDKSFEAGMTTPDPENLYKLLGMMRDDGVEYVFMEVSSHSLALGRVAPICFCASIYTNLTSEHLDFHKTMDEYAEAKELLFRQSELGIFNIDNSYVKECADKAPCRTVTVSAESENADYTAENIKYRSMNGIEYDIVKSGKTVLKADCTVPGIISVYNTLGAAVCALLLGLSEKETEKGIYSLKGVPGRMEAVTHRQCPFSVIIDYAHTPDALENVINIIRSTRTDEQKLTVLFGCGGDRDKTKRPIMGDIATRLADFVIVTSDNCRSEDPELIIKDILAGIEGRGNYKVITDRRQAIEYAVLNAKDGDIILIAGKGHENYEITKEGKLPFSEKDEVNKSLKKRGL